MAPNGYCRNLTEKNIIKMLHHHAVILLLKMTKMTSFQYKEIRRFIYYSYYNAKIQIPKVYARSCRPFLKSFIFDYRSSTTRF